MEYTPISPFMRPISHIHFYSPGNNREPLAGKPINKWSLFRELVTARSAFGVTERDLAVLQGLLSFFPDDALGTGAEMVVFPSNRALSERLNGMPCSTMRRHVARLVEAGLLARRDSPNGKRYVRKIEGKRIPFGFDISVLLHRSQEIERASEAVREMEASIRRARETISLMRRDVSALIAFGEETNPGSILWDDFRSISFATTRDLRRKLTLSDLLNIQAELTALIARVRDHIELSKTEEMITKDDQSERHHHNTNKESTEVEATVVGPTVPDPIDNQLPASDQREELKLSRTPRIALHTVIAHCPSIESFYRSPIQHWHQLYDAVCRIRLAVGINSSAWNEAQKAMGPELAAAAVAAILERFAEIRSPGGYLRALARRAANGQFSSASMIVALGNRQSLNRC